MEIKMCKASLAERLQTGPWVGDRVEVGQVEAPDMIWGPLGYPGSISGGVPHSGLGVREGPLSALPAHQVL